MKIFIGMLILALLATACTSIPLPIEGSMIMPTEWSSEFDNLEEKCTDFSGTYKNNGLGYKHKVRDSFVGRLDVALGEPIPTDRVPDFVKLDFIQEREMLEVIFVGESTVSFAVNVECTSGWVEFIRFEENRYLGDGMNLDDSQKLIRLAFSANGNLFLHHVSIEVFSTLHFFKQKESGEYWYKFERAK